MTRILRSPVDLALTLLALVCAAAWAFPLYWAAVTTLKPEYQVTQPGYHLLPQTWTLEAYRYALRTARSSPGTSIRP
jgi:multiple sugar transport system permease protein